MRIKRKAGETQGGRDNLCLLVHQQGKGRSPAGVSRCAPSMIPEMAQLRKDNLYLSSLTTLLNVSRESCHGTAVLPLTS